MSIKTVLLRTIIRHNKFNNYAAVGIHYKNHDKHGGGQAKSSRYTKTITAALLSSALVGSTLTEQIEKKKVSKGKLQKADCVTLEAGQKRPDLPTYRAEEVSKHDNKNSFWVTYKNGVYDVTEFLSSHPGGDQIMNAAGLSIEPFWNVYGMHKTQEVYTLLETYRIGNLHEDDIVDHSDDELWAKEPFRDPRLIVRTAKPFNAEIPAEYQVEYFDTPNELFYVRQHMPVPELDAHSHRVRVTVCAGAGAGHTRELSLRDLSRFPRVRLRAALMCAGNRRSEMNNESKPVKGISWTGGAISNAVWEGVYLRDVLIHCGVDVENTEGKHVILTGADVDVTGENFSTSIPLQQAVDPAARVLLATHMNGRPLPPDHGRPLRALVPGAPAVRSVKWLESITVSEQESPSHWHQKDYRSFNASTTWETADFARAPPLYSVPVTSALCAPSTPLPVRAGRVALRGYAYSGGGAKILRVDVSTDRGKSWIQADHVASDDAPPRQHYAWTLWAVTVPVARDQKELEVWVKATDSNFNTQPEKFDDIWNIRGLLANAYHKVKVPLQH